MWGRREAKGRVRRGRERKHAPPRCPIEKTPTVAPTLPTPVEIRGGARPVKATSTPRRVLANSEAWGEDLTLEVLEGASELRLMLCREKRVGARVGTSVVAACGIFVSDILDAVPIDKFFELFKPGAGGEGGFIRIGVEFYPDAKALAARRGARGRRAGGVPIIPLLVAGGVALAAKFLLGRKQAEEGKDKKTK